MKTKWTRKQRASTRAMSTREEMNQEGPVALKVIQALLCSYVTTGILLAILAFLLYRFHLQESVIAIGIIVIYIISTFVGGFVLGKYMKEKKYLWGIILGILYVVLLFLITFGVYRTLNNGDIATTLVLCLSSGCIGGMLS